MLLTLWRAGYVTLEPEPIPRDEEEEKAAQKPQPRESSKLFGTEILPPSPQTSGQTSRRGQGPVRDQGSVLPMVMVLMVVGALIVLPTLTYAATVLRANDAVSTSTAEAEAVKAGFRMAMAEPSLANSRAPRALIPPPPAPAPRASP